MAWHQLLYPSKFFEIFKKFEGSFFIGDLIVEVYKDLNDVRNGKAICSKRIEGNEISRAGSWIHIDFNKKLKWDKTYYIVVHQDGGSDRQYYKWYYGNGNPYERGSSYDGNSLTWKWDENTDRDFCFRTYAHETGDEPDGIVERWAVIMLTIGKGAFYLMGGIQAISMCLYIQPLSK